MIGVRPLTVLTPTDVYTKYPYTTWYSSTMVQVDLVPCIHSLIYFALISDIVFPVHMHTHVILHDQCGPEKILRAPSSEVQYNQLQYSTTNYCTVPYWGVLSMTYWQLATRTGVSSSSYNSCTGTH